jgi:hypothetical protein
MGRVKKPGAKVGRPLTLNRKVMIVETGEVFDNYIEAAKAIDGNRSCVYLCLDPLVLRHSHKGYHFEYVD